MYATRSSRRTGVTNDWFTGSPIEAVMMTVELSGSVAGSETYKSFSARDFVTASQHSTFFRTHPGSRFITATQPRGIGSSQRGV